MPRRLLIPVLAGIVALLVLAPTALAKTATSATVSPNDPTSGELVEQPKTWDGKEITFTGEAIAEAQERGEFSWIHVNDDAYYLKNVEEGARLDGYNSGMAAWIPTELTKKIAYYGDYTHEGDVVVLRGVFNAACAQHGGDMDIHGTSLTVKIAGHMVREPVKLGKLGVAIALLVLATLLWVAHRRAEHLEAFGPGSSPRG